MFSQVGFPTISRHPRHDPVPMFVRYPRHRPRSVPSAAICATGLDLGHGVSSAPPAAIQAMTRHPPHRPRSALGLSRKRNKVNRCDDYKFRRELTQIERINSINL
jgi:hypothetical protein